MKWEIGIGWLLLVSVSANLPSHEALTKLRVSQIIFYTKLLHVNRWCQLVFNQRIKNLYLSFSGRKCAKKVSYLHRTSSLEIFPGDFMQFSPSLLAYWSACQMQLCRIPRSLIYRLYASPLTTLDLWTEVGGCGGISKVSQCWQQPGLNLLSSTWLHFNLVDLSSLLPKKGVSLGCINNFSFSFFLQSHLLHMEVSRRGVQSELQLPA